MSKFFFVLFLAVIAFVGFQMGEGRFAWEKKERKLAVHPEKEFPVTQFHPFTLIVYASNQVDWCQRALHSLFVQDYTPYRVVFIDDGSTDGTYEAAQQFIVDNSQDERVILIRNETRLGPCASLYRAVASCADREIVVAIEAKDWLAHEGVLTRLNSVFQNPDVWVASGYSLQYPAYETSEQGMTAFYAALMKQVKIEDLFVGNTPAMVQEAYLQPIVEMSGGRLRTLKEPLSFFNRAGFSLQERAERPSATRSPYQALASFPAAPPIRERVDLLAFSFDRPLQLYSLLESIDRYVSGLDKIRVLYRASEERYEKGYEEVKRAYPHIQFIRQSPEPRKDFKPLVLKAVFDSPSEYIVFAVDDIVVKDFVDVKGCAELMKKTGAYGFYLRFGSHTNHCYMNGQPQAIPPSFSLGNAAYAWHFQAGQFDWAFPHSLDMTLYRKGDLKTIFEKMKYKTPNQLEWSWAQKGAKSPIGLYFEHSKIVNLPLNIVNPSDCRHMNFLTTDEMLAKFNEGLKIDIDPLFRIENPSPHFEYTPEFIVR